LGPSCSANPNYQRDPYFYVDRLALAESSEFGIPFKAITGSICENDLILQAEENSESSYQWYLDGVAIPGETNASLFLSSLEDTEGTYLVVISGEQGCQFSQEYRLRFPPYYATDSASICEDDIYLFGQDTLTEPGFYERLLLATDGCDSIIQFSFHVIDKSYFDFQDSFCLGEDYLYHDIITSEEGIYETSLQNAAGCDSVITIDLTTIDQGLGIEIEETITIDLGTKIDLEPIFFDPKYVEFIWWDDSKHIISNELSAFDYQPIRSTTVFLEAFDLKGCSTIDSMTIEVEPFHTIYIPNVFSPDGNGINDFFGFYPSLAVERIHSFVIFDRWGDLIFQDYDIPDAQNYLGWDGTNNGKKANLGVYTYILKVLFIDGKVKILTGDVTLIR
jgi:gliding motility-associated-like protein